jgi:hypothetical protein
MDNLLRRKSGTYVVRLVSPTSLLRILGKRELIASTGARDLPLAKMVSSHQLPVWRRKLSGI